MPNLPEEATWEAGIYQLELTDPVEAGADGIDNLQAKQLANRTVYLKDQIDTGRVIPAVTPLPAAVAGDRGRLVRVEGAAGVADAVYIGVKLANGAYDWFQIF